MYIPLAAASMSAIDSIGTGAALPLISWRIAIASGILGVTIVAPGNRTRMMSLAWQCLKNDYNYRQLERVVVASVL